MPDNSIIVDLQAKGMENLVANLKNVGTGFEELSKGITDAKAKLATLDSGTAEFKKMSNEVKASEVALKSFSTTTDSLRKEIQQTKQALNEITQAMHAQKAAGLANTESYKALQAAYDKTAQHGKELKIAIAGVTTQLSDTHGLDVALRGISTLAGGYAAMQGILTLTGGAHKKFEETLLKLNAVMAITQGLQAVSAELSRQDSIAKIAAAKATALYSFVVGESTGALKIFKIALASTGIGLIVIALGTLVANWDKVSVAIGLTSERLEKITEVFSRIRDGIVAFFKESGKVILDILKGDWSAAYADAREIGKNIADNIASGAKKRLIELALDKDIAKETFLAQILGATGDKRDELILNLDIATKEAIKAMISGSEEVQQKTLLEKIKAEEALKAFDLDVEKKRLAAQKKAAEELLRQKLKELKDLADANKLGEEFFISRQKEIADAAKIAQDLRDVEAKDLADRKALKDKFNAEELAALDKQNAAIDAREHKSQSDAFKKQAQIQAQRDQERSEAEGRFKAIISIVSQTTDQINSLTTQGINVVANRELANLEERHRKHLISDKQFQKQSAAIKNEAAQKQRKADIAFAASRIPLAFLEALSSAPFPVNFIVAALAAAAGAVQLGLLIASPIPKFFKGVINLQDNKRPNGIDTVPAMLTKGESVMTAEETKAHEPVLRAIRNRTFEKLFIPKELALKADIFSNIPNPSNIPAPVKVEGKDYDSINQRLDKIATEMWWLNHRTKEGNTDRKTGTEKVVSKLESKSKIYV